MRHAFVIAVALTAGAACQDDNRKATLEQLRDTRTGPAPDSADGTSAGDATQEATSDTFDALDASEGESDTEDVGPVTCQDGATCDDGDPCTTVDVCRDGVCGGSGALACVDDDPCTEDRCSTGVGCELAPKSCDDGNACTTDECRSGVGCVSSAVICPPSEVACRTNRCDPEQGCVEVAAANGATCDDGLACTTDACREGECLGTATGCDDDNACTSDLCLPGAGCDHLVLPNCANEEACLGRVAGASCDDGDDGTSADMCLVGWCRGYRLSRIGGDTVDGQEGLVVKEIDDDGTSWSAVLWTVDGLLRQGYALADVSDPGTPQLYVNTVQDELFAGLRDGFVGDASGRLWSFESGAWSSDGPWDTALAARGRDAIGAIFSVRSGGDAHAGRLLWLVGGENGAWLRFCKQGESIFCAAQVLDDGGDSVPRAIGGVPHCESGSTCSGATLAVGADGLLGGGFNYTDVYENEDGLATAWSPTVLSETPANRATRAVGAWKEEAGVRFVLVGDNGYLLVRRADGGWLGPLALRDGQASRDFSGVWVGAGAVMVSATRLGSGNQTVYELWVAALASDLEEGGNWAIHELGRAPIADSAGLYDIRGRSDGEVRATGAVRRSGGLLDWLDGAIWVRSP